MYKVLMFGDRNWDKPKPIEDAIFKLTLKHGTFLVISGAARGADRMSAEIARANDIHVAEVEALWACKGRAAGPQRNQVMLDLEPDEAFCFHSDLANSKGSKNMKKLLDQAGIKVTVIS